MEKIEADDIKRLNLEIYQNSKKIKPNKQTVGFVYFATIAKSVTIEKIAKFYRISNIELLYKDNKQIHLYDKTKNFVFSLLDFDNKQKTYECEVMSKVYYDEIFVDIFI